MSDSYPDRMSVADSPSPSAARTLNVLEALVRAEDGLTLTALAKEAGSPLATCASIVYTLEERGYAARKVVGRSHFWRATLGLYGLAAQLVRNVDLSTVAQEDMRALAEELGMPVHIGVLSGASIVYVAKAAPAGFIQFDTYPGKMAPYNLTALGKAITANVEQERLAPLLRQMVVGSGPGAIPKGSEAFLAELATVRKQGYAVEREEEQADISCVAVPFFDSEGGAAGSIGVTGFEKDLKGKTFRRAVEGLRAIADDVSAQLGHQGTRRTAIKG
jgi:IclR family KDG regulon transcriptional repressor